MEIDDTEQLQFLAQQLNRSDSSLSSTRPAVQQNASQRQQTPPATSSAPANSTSQSTPAIGHSQPSHPPSRGRASNSPAPEPEPSQPAPTSDHILNYANAYQYDPPAAAPPTPTAGSTFDYTSYQAHDPITNLRVRSMPILDNLATQVLNTLTKPGHLDSLGIATSPETAEGQAFQVLISLFTQTKTIYCDSEFINAEEIGLEAEPYCRQIIQKANLATFVAALFGVYPMSFYLLDYYFLDTFVHPGSRLLKFQAALYLDLKTQAYIVTVQQRDDPRDYVLNNTFPDNMAEVLLKRRKADALAPSESDFVQRVKRRKEHLAALPYDTDLSQTYRWLSFIRDVADYVSKKLPVILTGKTQKPSPAAPMAAVAAGAGLETGSAGATSRRRYGGSEAARNGGEGTGSGPDSAYAKSRHGLSMVRDSNDTAESANEYDSGNAGVASSSEDVNRNKGLHGASNTDAQQQSAEQRAPSPAQQQAQQAPPQHQQVQLLQPLTAPPPRPPFFQRHPWNAAEEAALLEGLAAVKGPFWSQILEMYGSGGSVSEVLKDRNQVQLKDKARNLKLYYLKTNTPMPAVLKDVTGDVRSRGSGARKGRKARGSTAAAAAAAAANAAAAAATASADALANTQSQARQQRMAMPASSVAGMTSAANTPAPARAPAPSTRKNAPRAAPQQQKQQAPPPPHQYPAQPDLQQQQQQQMHYQAAQYPAAQSYTRRESAAAAADAAAGKHKPLDLIEILSNAATHVSAISDASAGKLNMGASAVTVAPPAMTTAPTAAPAAPASAAPAAAQVVAAAVKPDAEAPAVQPAAAAPTESQAPTEPPAQSPVPSPAPGPANASTGTESTPAAPGQESATAAQKPAQRETVQDKEPVKDSVPVVSISATTSDVRGSEERADKSQRASVDTGLQGTNSHAASTTAAIADSTETSGSAAGANGEDAAAETSSNAEKESGDTEPAVEISPAAADDAAPVSQPKDTSQESASKPASDDNESSTRSATEMRNGESDEHAERGEEKEADVMTLDSLIQQVGAYIDNEELHEGDNVAAVPASKDVSAVAGASESESLQQAWAALGRETEKETGEDKALTDGDADGEKEKPKEAEEAKTDNADEETEDVKAENGDEENAEEIESETQKLLSRIMEQEKEEEGETGATDEPTSDTSADSEEPAQEVDQEQPAAAGETTAAAATSDESQDHAVQPEEDADAHTASGRGLLDSVSDAMRAVRDAIMSQGPEDAGDTNGDTDDTSAAAQTENDGGDDGTSSTTQVDKDGDVDMS